MEGKREKFGLWEGACVRLIHLTGLWRYWANNVQVKWKAVCSFVKGKFCIFSAIVWKQSSSLHYSVFMNGTFPSKGAGDSKSLTSLEHDKSVTHRSVGKAINFLLPVSDFVSFSLLFMWGHSFQKGYKRAHSTPRQPGPSTMRSGCSDQHQGQLLPMCKSLTNIDFDQQMTLAHFHLSANNSDPPHNIHTNAKVYLKPYTFKKNRYWVWFLLHF